jgi:hypothetical protein
MNCMTFDEVGVKGGWLSMGVPNMHRMSSLSLAKHVHNIVEHCIGITIAGSCYLRV